MKRNSSISNWVTDKYAWYFLFADGEVRPNDHFSSQIRVFFIWIKSCFFWKQVTFVIWYNLSISISIDSSPLLVEPFFGAGRTLPSYSCSEFQRNGDNPARPKHKKQRNSSFRVVIFFKFEIFRDLSTFLMSARAGIGCNGSLWSSNDLFW